MKNKNQTTELLKHLQTKGSITSVEAFQLYGITRLSAKIYNLRRKGYDIETLDVVGKTRYGETCTYAKYIYHEREV